MLCLAGAALPKERIHQPIVADSNRLTTSPTLDPMSSGSNGPRSWPAIDAGKTDAVPGDTLDLDNDGDTDELLPYDDESALAPCSRSVTV